MAFLKGKNLKIQAKERISATNADTRMLVLIYCGVIAALSLGSSGLELYLDSQISSTGGLSGLGLRSVLQTTQSVLRYVNILFGPLWQAGFLFAIIGIVRRQSVSPKSLAEGFRRFGRILIYYLDLMMILFLIMMASIYGASILFSFSPWGADFAEAMGPVLTDPNLFTAEGAINMDMIPMEAMIIAGPALSFFLLLTFLPLYGFLSYSLRLGQYLLMEGGRITGMTAIFLSFRMMKGHRWQMLKLDLSFWWYHGLHFLATLVLYLDVLFRIAGIQTPIDGTVFFFVTTIGYCLMDLAISLWKKCEVDAAYVLAYEAIVHPDEPEEASDPASDVIRPASSVSQ